MESSKSNSSEVDKETDSTDKDGNPKPTTSSSSSPKRYKLDPNAPSTSKQTEADTNHTSNMDVSVGDNAADPSHEPKPENETKSPTGRFARRNYRKHSDSQSSTSSVPIEDSTTEQNTENETCPNRNNQEESNPEPSLIPDDAIMSLFNDDSTFDLDDNSDDDDDDDESSASESGNSTESEQKIQVILNKPRPKCDLNLVRNLIYRQSGIMYRGKKMDVFSNDLTHRISSSIYSVERMMLLHKLQRHFGCVNCLNFNKAGTLLASGADDLKVVVWDWAKQQPIIIQTSGHRSNVFQSKFVDAGCDNNQIHLITSARDGEVRQLQIRPDGSAQERLITRHTNYPVHKIAIPESNPNEVLTAGEDGCVMRSDLRDHRSSERLVQLTVNGDDVPLYSIAHHPFDSEFCICGREKFVRVYDKRNVKECSKMFCPENILKQTKGSSYINITCALYNYVGNEILASYGDENIYLFDTAVSTPGTYKHTYYGHKNQQTIKGVNFFGLCSEFIMSGSDCGNIFIWDKNNEAIIQWLHGDNKGAVNCLEGHPTFPIIATSGLEHDVKIWSPMNPNGRPSQTDLKRCIKENLNHSNENFVRTYMRNIARLVNDGFHRSERSSNDDDSSDSDDEDNGLRTFYRPDRGPCEVQ